MMKMELMMLAVLALLVTAATTAEASRRNRTANQQRRKSLTLTSLSRPNRGRRTTTTTAATPLDDDGADGRLASDQPGVETCEVARLKCAYRVGCGMALQNYMEGCSDVITGSTKKCSDHCRNSLIALTSTEEGEALMKCKCSDNFCMDAKRRIDICRPAVQRATKNNTAVSCSVAQWICLADPVCSTALDYYNQYCRSMFAGKKCTLRCKNSISILRRQEKAAKLSSCVCDGSEDYDCPAILNNMERLCFHHQKPHPPPTTPSPKPRPHHHPKPPRPHHPPTTTTTSPPPPPPPPSPPIVEIETNDVEVRRVPPSPPTNHVMVTSPAPTVTSPVSSSPPLLQVLAPLQLFFFVFSVRFFWMNV